jgi:Ca2+-binding EF-hand superfamily protein
VLTPQDAFQLFDEDGSNSIDFEEFSSLCDYCGLSHVEEKERRSKII